MDIIEILSDSARKKAVDNPKARLGDPKCWDCLTDEQRDTINEWYINLLIDREINREKEEKARGNRETYIAWLSMLPVSVFSAYRQCGGYNELPRFLSCFLASLFWHSIMCGLVCLVGDVAIPIDFDSRAQKVLRYILVAVVTVFVSIVIIERCFPQ